MTLDRINEYFAFATSALVTGVGVMTVSEKLALAGLLLGIVPPSGWRFIAAELSRPASAATT